MHPANSRSPRSRVLFESHGITIGRFVCNAGDRGFCGPARIPVSQVVFPCRPVVVRRQSGLFLADPTVAGIYRRDEEYEREAATGHDDHHYWVSLSDDTACLAPPEKGAFVRRSRGFRRQQAFFRRLEQDLIPDRLEAEETAIGLLVEVAREIPTREGTTLRYAEVSRDTVEAVKARIAAERERPMPFARLAAEVGLTPFTLYRAFRALAGTTIHGYATEMRLRLAWTLLEETTDSITDVALAAGFSSHSHFTAAFRHRFGIVPSRHPART